MRMLALSDLHGHVQDVRRIRELETNRFDAVVVAGDICGLGDDRKSVPDTMGILSTFGCPVLFVLGNWDSHLPYNADVLRPGHHLHMAPVIVNGYCFVGYSGCHEGWGHNPVATRAKQDLRERHCGPLREMEAIDEADLGDRAKHNRRQRLMSTPEWQDYLVDKKSLRLPLAQVNADEAMAAALETGVRPDHIVFLSHSRVPHLHERDPAPGMHLFGHKHGFRHTFIWYLETINVSAADMRCGVYLKGDTKFIGRGIGRDFNFGTYAVIEIPASGRPAASAPRLWPDQGDWLRLPQSVGGDDVHCV